MGNSKAEQWENGLFAGSPQDGELGGAALCGEGGFSPSKLWLLGAPPKPPAHCKRLPAFASAIRLGGGCFS